MPVRFIMDRSPFNVFLIILYNDFTWIPVFIVDIMCIDCYGFSVVFSIVNGFATQHNLKRYRYSDVNQNENLQTPK